MTVYIRRSINPDRVTRINNAYLIDVYGSSILIKAENPWDNGWYDNVIFCEVN